MTEIDPGASLITPGGTGPLGHPIGNGLTWGALSNDGSVGGGTNQAGAGDNVDASGTR